MADASAQATEEGLVFTPRFGPEGLVPAVVTDAATGQPLMFAFMNEEALKLTLQTGEAHFWSRSRKRLWRKGETSGNVLRAVAVYTDCDQDAIWVQATLDGDAACHTGRRSCFYREVALSEEGDFQLRWAE